MLHTAVRYKDNKLVAFLLDKDLDINNVGTDAQSDTILSLIERGANASTLDREGNAAFGVLVNQYCNL